MRPSEIGTKNALILSKRAAGERVEGCVIERRSVARLHSMLQAQLAIPHRTGLRIAIEQDRPLRLSTMAWDFPERPDLIALTSVSDRLDFLRDHLKSLCGLWDKLPRLFLGVYFRDIAACISRNHPALDTLAAAHGGLFRAEDWSFSALYPLPQARLPAAPETPVDFAFWTGANLYAVIVNSAVSQARVRRDALA